MTISFRLPQASAKPLVVQQATLRDWLLSTKQAQKSTSYVPKRFIVVDVRDDDYYGGHINGAINVPSRQFAENLDMLVAALKDYDTVIFHCALSQIRGPAAAKKYLNRLKEVGQSGQKVLVLSGGFVAWQIRYGEDKALTADYDRRIWEKYLE
jgi:rhodanese-related sulfurtransferase